MSILGAFVFNTTFWSKRWGELTSLADDTKLGEPAYALKNSGLPLSETSQAGRMGQQEPNEIQQGQMQSPTPGKEELAQ